MNITQAYELQLIARLLSDGNTYFENSDTITEAIFTYYPDVFAAYKKAFVEGRQLTMQRVVAELPQHSAAIIKAIKEIDYGIYIQELVAELSETSRQTTIDNALALASSKTTSEEKMQVIASLLTGVAQMDRITFYTGFDVAIEILKNIEAKKHIGILTGFEPFDRLTGGLQKSDLVIIAAETSQGKTALAMNIAQNVVDNGCGVFFMSFEMSKEQVVMRMICSKVEIAKNDLLRNMALYQESAGTLHRLPFFISDIGRNSIEKVASAIRTAKLRYNIELACIDYLQLLEDKSRQSREQEIGQIARMLKNLAKELDICIIALSQLKRPTVGNNHRPTMARLRDSGQIEEAADVIWFIYRPEVYGIDTYEGENTEGLAEMIIAKGRNYGTGKWKTQFIGAYTKFIGSKLTAGNGNAKALAAPSYEDYTPF